MNYKKSILSLVTIMALSGTASADGLASYLPLTTADNDGSWILFGVNGFSSGIASSRGVVASDFSADFIELEDTVTTDALATWGISAGGNTQPADDNMLAVQGIDDVNLGVLKVAVINDQPYEATEPVRSMYIKLNSTSPNVKIDYKSSLEGKILELIYGTTKTVYAVTINQDNTYSNPAKAELALPAEVIIPQYKNISDVLDYQLANNPLDARYYSKDDHLDKESTLTPAKVETATFYHFDSVSQEWKIWNTNFSGVANDFTEFSQGDAYWGVIDIDSNPVVNSPTVATDSNGSTVKGSGLILGTSGLAAHDTSPYINDDNSSKLVKGWNMIAFDDVAPYVRRAATGLIVTTNVAGGDLNITDSTGVNTVTVTLAGVQSLVGVAADANATNIAIESAKLNGSIPDSFNVRAFGSTATDMVLISDAKFSITDIATAGSAVDDVTTLTGNKPYVSGVRTTVTDLGISGQAIAESSYGEYAVILDLMTNDLRAGGVDTVAVDLDMNATNASGGATESAKIIIGTATQDYAPTLLSDEDTAATVTTAIAEVAKHALFSKTVGDVNDYGLMTPIESVNNAIPDKVILASTTPFYVKDATYTRVFEYQADSADDTRTLTVAGSAKYALTPPSATDTAAGVAALINAAADVAGEGTGVYASEDSTGDKIIAVSTTLSTFDLKDLESGTNQFLIPSTSTDDMAKGAIAGVYALDTIAKMPLIQNSFSAYMTTTPLAGDAGDVVDFAIVVGGVTVDNNTTIVGALADDANNTTLRLDFFDRIITTINSDIARAGVSAYAYHNYSRDTDQYSAAKVTIVGLDIDSVTITDQNLTFTTPQDDNNATAGSQGTDWSAITSDLTANAVYTPDYAIRGPLYTMRKAGFDTRAILKATTDLNSTVKNDIGWDSIDLTRDESDWFKNNEFNMFTTSLNAGYWVYLEDRREDSVTITNPNFIPTYTYYFDNKNDNDEYLTTNIINGGQFTVNIDGFDGEISNAYVSLNGVEIQLKQNGQSTEYTANFTKYDVSTLAEGSSGPLSMTIRATDGKGEESLTYDAYAFDYTAPTMNAPTAPNTNTVGFSSDDSTTAAYHVFRNYIPELETSRADADADINRLVGSYPATDGNATLNVCAGLDFGNIDLLRVVAADAGSTGTGAIGSSNLSNAEQFTYAAMLKNALVLSDTGGDTTKSIIGLRYDDSCGVATTQQVDAEDNTGVSLKTIAAGQTARLSYEEIDGVSGSLSGAWVSSYSISGAEVIQVQNLQEYANKPFFIDYGGKMYISAFPEYEADSIASQTSPIPLDSNDLFGLTTAGDNNGTSTGQAIDVFNNSLASPL